MSRKMIQRRASLIDIGCTLERETEKAVQVTTGVTAEVWVPKSLCEIAKKHEHHEMPCEGTITLPESLAIDKELV